MKFIFTHAEHQEHGTEGWCPNWMQHADPLGGMGVAHDIMEHPAKDDGSIANELRAFGAMLHTRHDGGYWHSKGTYRPEWWANTNHEIFEDMLRAGMRDGGWLPMPSCKVYRLSEAHEYQLAKCASEIRKLIESEAYDEDEKKDLWANFTHDHAHRMVAYLREGYRMAKKRYGKRDPYELADDFRRIEEKADKLLSHSSMGDQLIVSYSYSQGLRDIYTKEGRNYD